MKKRKSAIKGVNDWTLPKFRLLLTIRILSFTRRSRERSVSLLNFQSSYFVSLSIVIIELQSRSSKAQTSTNLITFSRPKHFIFKMKKFDAAKLFFFCHQKPKSVLRSWLCFTLQQNIICTQICQGYTTQHDVSIYMQAGQTYFLVKFQHF